MDACGGLNNALMHGQQSTNANIHLCVLDLRMTLTDLLPLATREPDVEIADDSEITQWERSLILIRL